MLSSARGDAKLSALAAELGDQAAAGGVREAVRFGDLVVLSVATPGYG